MAYATIAQLRAYLTQVPAGEANDALLGDILDRATSIVDGVLGFSFAGYAAGTKVVHTGHGTPYLVLPAHEAGSVTVVETAAGDDLAGFWQELSDGTLYAVGASGGWGNWWSGSVGLLPAAWGYSYTVTADWGYGDPPDSIVEVTLELAVNIWRGRTRGLFSDVVGVEGNGAVTVGYQGALTNQQKMTIQAVKAKYLQVVV